MTSAEESNNTEKNKVLLRRWFDEVWNKRRPEAIDEMLASDAIVHGLSDDPESPLEGPSGFKPFHEIFRGAFADIEVVIEDMIAERDKVAARCSVRAKHAGDHLGIAATGAAVDFTGIAIVRVRDGKFVEAWNNFDFMRMNKQIGVI
jgi:predicted ester cyclase